MRKEIYGKKRSETEAFLISHPLGEMAVCTAALLMVMGGGFVNCNMSLSLHNLRASHSNFGWMN